MLAACTHHSAPSVPGVELVSIFNHLDDIKLVVVLSNVGLVEHAVVVLMHLVETAHSLSV